MHNRIRHAIQSIYYAAKRNNVKETLQAVSQDNTEVERGSLDALRELLTYVGQVQAELLQLHSQNIADIDRTNIELLRRENELLKEVLSDLDRLISEKL